MDLSEERPLVVVMRSATGQKKQVIIVYTTIVNINFTCHDYDFSTFFIITTIYLIDLTYFISLFILFVLLLKQICFYLIVDLFHNFDLVPHYGLIIFFYFTS